MKKGKAPIKEQKEFDEEVIQIDRVTRVVKGGRRLRFRATVAIGNKKGKVGVGIGKSTEVTGAIQKAISHAKKNMIKVPMVEQTIPHKVKVKYKSAKLLLMPACPGTGIIAGGPLRKIFELAGIKDILAKCLGNNNRVTNSQATVIALARMQQIPWLAKKTPVEEPKVKEPKKEGKKEVKEKPQKKATLKKSEKKRETLKVQSGPKTAKKEEKVKE